MEACNLHWQDSSRRSQAGAAGERYTAEFCGFSACIHHHIDHGSAWLLTCRDLNIVHEPLCSVQDTPFPKAEGIIASALRDVSERYAKALTQLGDKAAVTVDTTLGSLLAYDIGNDTLPGIAIDLEPTAGEPKCNLLHLQMEDDGRLYATLYTEIGSNADDGSGSGDYSHCFHCVGFVKSGETAHERTEEHIIERLSRTELAEASRRYDYILAQETVISRMKEKGYENPAKNYPDALSEVIAAYFKNRRFGCEEAFSMDDALDTLPLCVNK